LSVSATSTPAKECLQAFEIRTVETPFLAGAAFRVWRCRQRGCPADAGCDFLGLASPNFLARIAGHSSGGHTAKTAPRDPGDVAVSDVEGRARGKLALKFQGRAKIARVGHLYPGLALLPATPGYFIHFKRL
jgi:hypothetical protein